MRNKSITKYLNYDIVSKFKSFSIRNKFIRVRNYRNGILCLFVNNSSLTTNSAWSAFFIQPVTG